MTSRPRNPAEPKVAGPKAAVRGPKPPTRPAQRQAQSSTPEISTRFEPVGRETLAVIAAELVGGPPAARKSEGPEIEVVDSTLGRETLAAIASELASDAAVDQTDERREANRRLHRRTLGYEEEAAFGGALARGARPKGDPAVDSRAMDPGQLENALGIAGNLGCDVYEMVTFVVRGDLARLSSTRARRDFVAERLLHRLPVASMAEVDRVDVTPWTVHGTVIVRVWCLVPPV